MKKALLLCGLVALVAFSGCVQQDIRPAAKNLPEIREIFEEHPNAYMDALFMRKDVVKLIINDIRKDCGQEMQIASYWYVTVRVDTAVTELYLDESVQKILCVIKPPSEPQHECNTSSQCDDNDVATKDECKGIPRKCVNTLITLCVSGDGYCPTGCVYNNDNDCPAVDECRFDSDCTDSNKFTRDRCSGTPKQCYHELKSCGELNEHLCETYEVCLGDALPTTDSGVCCDVPCTKTKSCKGVTCLPEQKCVSGNCVDKSCAERNLPLCIYSEICTDEYYKDPFGIRCCTGECRQLCTSDVNCSQGEVCKDDYCIARSCGDIGGKTCNATTEKCTGESERTLDNDNCCLQCTLKRCKERSGIVCDISKGEECSSSTVQTFDIEECCLAECMLDWCFDKPCAINKKCLEEKCVFKTCEELDGIDCGQALLCEGNFYRTKDVAECCTAECK